MNPTTIRTLIGKVINAGTHKANEEHINGLRLLNTLCFLTGIMVYGIGLFFYSLVKSTPLLIGVIFEGSVFLGLIYLTARYANIKKSAFGMLMIHVFSAVYFGALLGMAISTELVGLFLLVFLVLSSFFIFKNYKVVALNIGITALLMVAIEFNNYHHIIEPIALDHTNLFIFRWFSIGGMFILTFAVSASFIKLVLSLVKKIGDNDNNRKDFLIKTSHELKTPFNTILSLAATHMDTIGDPELRRLLHTVVIAASHGLKVVNNIQEVAKIEAGRPSEIIKRPFDVKKFADQIYNMMYLAAQNKDQKINVLYARNRVPRRITTDETVLSQILLNLLTNAIKYAPVGSFIYIKMDYDDGHMLFTVCNAGGKIDPQWAQQLFSSFVSSDYTANGGTGLGLMISKQYANRLGGTLTLSTSAVEGQEISFLLSIPAAKNEKLPEYESQYINAIEKVSILIGKKVLLIDDEEVYFRSIKHLFSQCETFYARDGESGIQTAIAIQPDLILLDSELKSTMSGKDILVQLKSISILKDIPVILVTANTFKEAQEEFLLAGAAEVLPKPLALDSAGAIRKHFAG